MQINKIFINFNQQTRQSQKNTDKTSSKFITNSISFQASQGITALVQGELASQTKQLSLSNIQKYRKELFTPIESLKSRIINRLMSIDVDSGDFPEELKNKLISTIKSDNFNLDKIYQEFYSLLLICTTLQDVDSMFPTIKFPRTPSTTNYDNDNIVIKTKGRPYKTPLRGDHLKSLANGLKPKGLKIKKHSNELPILKDFIRENAPQNFTENEIDNILRAYNHVPMDKVSLDDFKTLLSLKNPKTNEYITSESISGLFDTMSIYVIQSNQKCKNILKTYITLQKDNQTAAACALAKILTSGNKSKLAERISSIRNDDELNAFLETIKTGDIYLEQISSCRVFSELYNLTKNLDLVNDFKRIFNITEINNFIKIFKAAPNTLEKGLSYTSNIKPESELVNKEDVKTILEKLGVSENEQFVSLLDLFEQTEELKEYALHPNSFKIRFKNANFDKSIIEAIQKLYLEKTALSNVIIHINENDSARATSFAKYNNEIWSVPNAEMLKTIKESEEIALKLNILSESLQELSEDELKEIALTNSTKNFWRDFHDYTRASWLAVRLIKDKKHNENTLYTIDNLINAYIYKLFVEYKDGGKSPEELGANPLSLVNESIHLSKGLKTIIDDSYLTIYKSRSESPYLFDQNVFDPTCTKESTIKKEYAEFYSQFDIEALKRSFEKLETLYKKRFYRIYTFSNNRYKILEKDLKNELKIVLEKRDFKSKTNTESSISEIDKNVAINLIDETFRQVDEDVLNSLKYMINNIKNPELKTRCQSILNNESIDADYFNYIHNILKASVLNTGEETSTLFEEKALVLFMLNDKYLSNCIENISEEEFIAKELRNYKLPDGSYDYKAFYDNSKAELNFFTQMNKLENLNEEEFFNYIMKISNESNFEVLSELINDYISIPQITKDLIKTDLITRNLEIKLDIIKKTINEYKKSLWDLEKPEIIILNDAGINKKVVITPKAKKEIFEYHHGNIAKYENEISKFIKAADKYAMEEKSSGIKAVRKDGSFEIKIYGKSGSGGMRLYSRPVTNEDVQLYKIDENDDLPLKYIFDKYDNHL